MKLSKHISSGPLFAEAIQPSDRLRNTLHENLSSTRSDAKDENSRFYPDGSLGDDVNLTEKLPSPHKTHKSSDDRSFCCPLQGQLNK